ncbi:MAG: LysR family transcriptional regulator, partial [Phycisphaeraceae bacterium]|nr:LysR family transcriptional regulator [Phycisphaeraceae bacterium]MCC7407957.1 LysR family transcriptional regulator [Phycisphaeraceae bacterium]
MQSLRLFCDVAGHRSFSLAAKKHGITQSAVSQRVGQLEKRLGVTLLDRSVRPLALTPAGELFLRE